MSASKWRWTVFWLVALAAALRVAGIDFGLPGKFRPDEEYVLGPAVSFHSGDLNPHIFNYPSLIFYLVSLVLLLFRGVWSLSHLSPNGDFLAFNSAYEWAPAYLAGRLVSAAFGVSSVALLAHVAQKFYSARVSIALSLLLAFNLLHVRDSHFATTDVALGFFALATMLPLANVVRLGRWRDALWAALAIGLASATKYPAVVLFGSYAIAHLGRLAIQPGWWRVKQFYLQPLAVAMLASLTFFCCSPYVFIDHAGVREWLGAVQSFAEHGLPGLAEQHGIRWVLRFLVLSFGKPELFLLIAGMLFVIYGALRRQHAAWSIAPAIPFLVALLVIYLGAKWVPIRYFVPLIPVGLLLAGTALSEVEQLIPERFRNVVFAFGVMAIALGPCERSLELVRLLSRSDSRIAASFWIQTHLPKDAEISVQDFPYGKPPLPMGMRYKLIPDGAPSSDAIWAVTDEHDIHYFSRGVTRAFGEAVRQRGSEIFSLIPYSELGVVDPSDAFYVPLDTYSKVQHPGTGVRVFRLQK